MSVEADRLKVLAYGPVCSDLSDIDRNMMLEEGFREMADTHEKLQEDTQALEGEIADITADLDAATREAERLEGDLEDLAPLLKAVKRWYATNTMDNPAEYAIAHEELSQLCSQLTSKGIL